MSATSHAVVRAWRGRRRAAAVATTSDFRPHPLLRNPHLQTVLPELLRPRAGALRRERLELDDGDFVDLGWAGAGGGAGAPLAILVHGVAGGLDSRYASSMAQVLGSCGWRCATLQLRGAGPEPNRLPQGYHHGDTADFRHVARLLRQREVAPAVVAVGWSLGAGIVLKALGEEGPRSPLDAAVAISAPLRLRECAEHLRRGSARIYQALMLWHLKRAIRRKHARVPLPAAANLAAALAARDFFELGDAYTAPLNGFRDVHDYCRRAACESWLRRIRRPTLILQARDDPFLGSALLPRVALPACVRLELAEHGGHAGFIAADRWQRPVFWLEQRVPQFLQIHARP